MNDLNSAMDGLRAVMPYARGPSVRKLSKIASLLLARNYIVQLQSRVCQLESELHEFKTVTQSGNLHNFQMNESDSEASVDIFTCNSGNSKNLFLGTYFSSGASKPLQIDSLEFPESNLGASGFAASEERAVKKPRVNFADINTLA